MICLGSMLINISLPAEEGMWMPLFLDALNIDEMQDKGLRLSAADIYDINNSSLTDAVVIFGRGCTGELISDKGLVITNHHCGLGQIQSHSSLSNDYITDGFWAANTGEELPNPGLTVTFLKGIEDVTGNVLEGVGPGTDDVRRIGIVQANIDYIKDSVSAVSDWDVEIKEFYYGNEYYMFLYEVFSDVRLVGAPPSSIGKFGGDTDNWMWPRHTGDFSLFRIYADSENLPAEYSPDNVPYRPEVHLPVSLKGFEMDDFTMVFGYPGSTFQFQTSHGIRQMTEKTVPAKIRVRTERMNIMQSAMDADAGVRIKYTSKYARVANAWKKWIGMLRGLDRLDAVNRKIEAEQSFQQWTDRTDESRQEYGSLLSHFDSLYTELDEYILASDYAREIVQAIELFGLISDLADIYFYYLEIDEDPGLKYDPDPETLASIQRFFKDYHEPVDRQVFVSLMRIYLADLPEEFHSEYLNSLLKKNKADLNKVADYVFTKSVFASEDELTSLFTMLDKKKIKTIRKDPAFKIYMQLLSNLMVADFHTYRINQQLDQAYRKYVRGLIEMQADRRFYPDANFTMRITYGKIDDYDPRDAVNFKYYTTLDGIMQKDNPEIYDYDVPEKLKELYREKDYGKYGRGDTLHVCFISSNHTSGGNSGSPVLNASGELIGVNFDRNWEGTMSDYMYDPDQVRNISLDIRYALFIIDKFAGATHLVDEMTLVE